MRKIFILFCCFCINFSFVYSRSLKDWLEAIKSSGEMDPLDSIEITQEIDTYVQGLIKGGFSNEGMWLDARVFNPNRAVWDKYYLKKMKEERESTSLSYAQKKYFFPGDRAFFVGDSHGDMNVLSALFSDLQKKCVLDEDFKIIDLKDKIFFLGDYSERGTFSLEVLYTLMKFKNNNPDKNVFLIRGNHEFGTMNVPDASTWSENAASLLGELIEDYGDSEGWNIFSEICYFYNFLPAIVFVGCNGNFIECVHGGIDPGYSPINFLKKMPAEYEFLDKNYEGLFWTDFEIDGYFGETVLNKTRGAGFVTDLAGAINYLKELNLELSTVGITLRDFFRGHQHNFSNLKLFGSSIGFVRDYGMSRWKEVFRECTSFNIAEANPIFTFSNGGSCCLIENKFGYGILTFAERYEDWILTPVEGVLEA